MTIETMYYILCILNENAEKCRSEYDVAKEEYNRICDSEERGEKSDAAKKFMEEKYEPSRKNYPKQKTHLEH